MQLIDYLKGIEKSVSAFARDIEQPSGTIHKIASRQRQPSLSLGLKIASATGGKVTLSDMELTDAERAAIARPTDPQAAKAAA